ncbi:MAG: NADP-dependent oxidoreductase [Sediminimonas sp.]|uniref:NADP-dependent oxidoreductase n=1 Tax=Sediminimonas sp. TaxID=2823379 RepID=UPI00287013B0|nr:NADP-dependent oxidoreductase [Sediminimonas sp.]MDR9484927.1 NADP-dependent oxidoreductase [Sediminimonas sp.]
MTDTMQRIALARRPDGEPVPEDFRLEDIPMPDPADGEVLVKVHYMSLDPYMRGRMDDAKSYATPVPVGGTMEGGAVGEVIASKSDAFAPGDYAFGMFGWASHGCLPARELRKLDPAHGPLTAALGVLGMPGFTGWFGLTEYGKPQKGETVVVAAATGPVGSMVGQVAKARGCRVVGVAGGPEKCALATDKFGFDACLDHRAYADGKEMRDALAKACPDGIDVYFENVGGKVLEGVLPLMNVGGRIPVCGMISWYNAGGLGDNASSDKDNLPKLWRTILVNRLHVHGFIISDQFDHYPRFLSEIGPKVAAGEIGIQEDIAEGLENAPEAFMGMLKGRNFGKQIVKIT